MIETFNAETVWNKTDKPPVVRISSYGHIRFSVAAVKVLGLVDGDKMTFQIDHRDTGVIYFFRDEKNGIPMRRGNDCESGIRLEVCCRPLAKKLLKFFDFNGNKTFDLTNEKTEGRFFILKKRVHVPIKWRKKETAV